MISKTDLIKGLTDLIAECCAEYTLQFKQNSFI